MCPRGNVRALARAPTLSGSGAAASEEVSGDFGDTVAAAVGESKESKWFLSIKVAARGGFVTVSCEQCTVFLPVPAHEMVAERRLETAPPPIRDIIKTTEKQVTQVGAARSLMRVAAVPPAEVLIKDPLNQWPQELNKELWGLLSDNNFHPLIVLLKVRQKLSQPM